MRDNKNKFDQESTSLYTLIKNAFKSFEQKNKHRIIIIILMMAAIAFMEAMGAALIVPYVAMINDPAQIINNQKFKAIFGQHPQVNAEHLIIIFSLTLLIFFLAKNTFATWAYNKQFKVIYSSMSDNSTVMLRQYMTRPLTEHTETNSSVLIRNITNEVNLFYINFLIPTLTCLSEVMVLLAIVSALLIIAPIPSISAMTVLGSLTTIFYITIKKKAGYYGKQAQNANAERIRWVNQSINAFKESKLAGIEEYFVRQFHDHEKSFANSSRYAMLLNQTPRLFIETLAYSSLFIGVLIAVKLGLNTQEILPILALFAVAAVRLLPSINRIIQSLTRMSYYRHSAEVVLHEGHHNKNSTTQNKNLIKNRANFDNWEKIIFDDVSFSYKKNSTPTLENINIALNRYESIALIGSSGSGKTTFVDLLLGLLTPTSGTIKIDGVDMAINCRDWQNKIAYIPQAIYLIDSDIRSNVALGVSQEAIDDERIWESLSQASIADFIKEQKEGLNFLIGENGSKLSGGQRQRIGIARALYRQPTLLVMDESTSALDEQTEREISDTIKNLADRCTFIIIAHRQETIKNCKIIYRITDGNICI